MAKIKAPLFSLDASGTLDKTLTYRKKPQNNTASKYAKPGDKNPFESSPRQKDQRSIIGLITACWQSKTNLDKLSWDASAKAARFKGSGYHYFLHLAKTDLKTYLGLVGFWSMNYNVGDKIPDLSGNNNYGTLMPIYPCDCPQPVDSISKNQGKALSFDGVNDYVSLGTLDNLSGNSLTVSFWAKQLEFIDWRGFISSSYGTTSPDVRLHLGYYWSGSPYFIIQIGDGISFQTIVTSHTIPFNVFKYYTITIDTHTCSFYIDGILFKQVATTRILAPGHFKIARSYSASYYLKCVIDEFTIYNRPLSLKEVQRLYSLFS